MSHEIVYNMDLVREICAAIHSLRSKNGIRLRQPLARVTIIHPEVSKITHLASIIMDECNVKAVMFNETTYQ